MAAELQGTKVDNWDRLDEGPGYWMFSLRSTSDPIQGIGGIIYNCPCGCGRIGALPFSPRNPNVSGPGSAVWDWDGNEDSPTLTPSILHVAHPMGPIATDEERRQAACGWHGFLTAGVFRTC